MNKTKKLTQGAMLLAIIGALMLIDRQLSFMFSELILLGAPIVIAIYSTMYSIKDSIPLCVGLLALAILFGYLTTYIYMPISVVVGLAVSYAIKKGYDRRKINIVAAIVYVIAEVVVVFLISPLLGISVANQIEALNVSFNEIATMSGMSFILSSFNNLSLFLLVMLVVSTILMGVMEGYLTGLLVSILLKRLKIKDIGFKSALDIKMPVYMAYILIFFTACSFIILRIPDLRTNYEALTYIILCLSSVASLILAYYGYLFVNIYFSMRYKKRSGLLVFLLVVFLFPFSYIILIVVGFLYGAGPLRKYLENSIINKDEKK